jgi:quinohemoprotein ethanol dehydrogenase
MKSKLIVSYLIAAGAIATPSLALPAAADLSSCCTAGDKDFPKAGGNLGNQNYSSLTQINKSNIKNVGPVWMTRVSAAPATTPSPSPGTNHGGQQTAPIVVDGVIYMDTPLGDVIAVDGATGAVKWKWHPTTFEPVDNDRRGVSVGDGKVYTLADGDRVVALNKDTGAEVWVRQPTDSAGGSLGNIQKVATVYYDGMVYVGSNDADRNAIFALHSSTGELAWFFYGANQPETFDSRVFTDVNGNVVRADATSWGPDPSCPANGGVAPWIHGAIDPELGTIMVAFGNVRECGSSQDGTTRPGDNLFANTLVSLDAKTGAFKWHYQSIRHDIWDMDNTHAPLLADVNVGGQTRKVAFYGSKSGHIFSIDRTNGKPVTAVEVKPRTTDSRQLNPTTQTFPVLGRIVPECLVWEKLDPNNIPGNPWRAVPNYNGYQPDANGNLVYTEPNYLDPDKPFVTIPPEYMAGDPRPPHRKGCMYDTHFDLPVLSTTSQNGGMDWSAYAFSPNLNLIYIPYGINPVAHWRGAGGNGQRALGQYQTGGIAALDVSTTQVKWNKLTGQDMAHGQGPITTASDLLFIGQFDGHALALDAETGNELWRFQTGAGISSPPTTYTVNGEQYVAFFAGGTGIPYGNSVTSSDMLWAFKLGGQFKTASGSQENPTPAPLQIRRNVGGAAVEGASLLPANTVYLARANRTNDTAATQADGTAAGAMNPTHMRVPVGTTVTFLNPGAATFPNFPNTKLHCATQYFEGLFNFKLIPGQSAQYTFNRAGEYFFNDCTDPRPTGKVIAYLTPQDVPGALQFTPSTINMKADLFTAVHGVITARFTIPAGYTLDGEVKLKTPLSTTLFAAVSTSVHANGTMLEADFNKADIDNNVPAGDAVPLVLTANFMNAGVQKQLTSTATVRIMK